MYIEKLGLKEVIKNNFVKFEGTKDPTSELFFLTYNNNNY